MRLGLVGDETKKSFDGICGRSVCCAQKVIMRHDMRPRILVPDKRYAGKYVAMASFNDKRVVASGIKPEGVYQRAEDKGHKNPVVFFVPDRNMNCIY